MHSDADDMRSGTNRRSYVIHLRLVAFIIPLTVLAILQAPDRGKPHMKPQQMKMASTPMTPGMVPSLATSAAHAGTKNMTPLMPDSVSFGGRQPYYYPMNQNGYFSPQVMQHMQSYAGQWNANGSHGGLTPSQTSQSPFTPAPGTEGGGGKKARARARKPGDAAVTSGSRSDSAPMGSRVRVLRKIGQNQCTFYVGKEKFDDELLAIDKGEKNYTDKMSGVPNEAAMGNASSAQQSEESGPTTETPLKKRKRLKRLAKAHSAEKASNVANLEKAEKADAVSQADAVNTLEVSKGHPSSSLAHPGKHEREAKRKTLAYFKDLPGVSIAGIPAELAHQHDSGTKAVTFLIKENETRTPVLLSDPQLLTVRHFDQQCLEARRATPLERSITASLRPTGVNAEAIPSGEKGSPLITEGTLLAATVGAVERSFRATTAALADFVRSQTAKVPGSEEAAEFGTPFKQKDGMRVISICWDLESAYFKAMASEGKALSDDALDSEFGRIVQSCLTNFGEDLGGTDRRLFSTKVVLEDNILERLLHVSMPALCALILTVSRLKSALGSPLDTKEEALVVRCLENSPESEVENVELSVKLVRYISARSRVMVEFPTM